LYSTILKKTTTVKNLSSLNHYVLCKNVVEFFKANGSSLSMKKTATLWTDLFINKIISRLFQKWCSKRLILPWNHWIYRLFRNTSRYCRGRQI